MTITAFSKMVGYALKVSILQLFGSCGLFVFCFKFLFICKLKLAMSRTVDQRGARSIFLVVTCDILVITMGVA